MAQKPLQFATDRAGLRGNSNRLCALLARKEPCFAKREARPSQQIRPIKFARTRFPAPTKTKSSRRTQLLRLQALDLGPAALAFGTFALGAAALDFEPATFDFGLETLDFGPGTSDFVPAAIAFRSRVSRFFFARRIRA